MTSRTIPAVSGRSVLVYADGGSRGNPGPAGYGAVVFDARSLDVLAERAAGLGRVTNNVAEYSGLIAGLEAAAEIGARQVEVRMDSKLVVEQMSGRWQVKHPDMKPLARKAAGLVAGFERVTFDWVPRAHNSHADRLANEAMDSAAQGRTWARDVSADRPPGSQTAVLEPSPAAPDRAGVTADRLRDPAAGRPETSRQASTIVLVVRHGETTWGSAGRFAGREDVPLTATGVRQARAVAARIAALQPQVVLTSPLQRCRDTATAIAGAGAGARAGAVVPVRPADGLLDGSLGIWTGLTSTQIESGWPEEFAQWRDDVEAAPPGGESFTEIRDRVSVVLDDIVRDRPGQVVVLVTHAAVAKMIMTRALGVPAATAYRMRVDTGSLSGYSVETDGTITVWAVNETGHLPD